ncbi:MAG: FIST C-terminal domain-containing protein [Defluviitaleaceae bacterium]|nr:FIST C-terminal domain-containing protein [Defluviitaleaceae bacterium]
MKSATAISYELDDILYAADELTDQIKERIELAKNSVAILHGQPDMEIGELSAAISERLGCRVVGGTTAAGALLTNEGYHELAVVLHVFTDDNCLFAAAISDSMTNDPDSEIKITYRRALLNLKEQDPSAEPKMVMCMATIVPSIATDNILQSVSNLCGGMPVFGYNAGDDFEFCKQQVYLDGESGGDKIVIMLMAGDIRPIFQTANLAGKKALEKRLVTKSRDNVIIEIEGRPAAEYLKNFPFINDETVTLFNYQFFVEMQNDAFNDGIPVSRALKSYDRETGEITCFANVPENSYIGLLYCDGNDVANTTEQGLKDFLRQLDEAAGGYKYTAVLAATCSLRNMFLTDMKKTEGDLIKNMMPSDLTVSGLYVFGEMAPTSVMENNKAVNRFHNATFTLCAF